VRFREGLSSLSPLNRHLIVQISCPVKQTVTL
jgi:hypothetical protein